MLFDDLASRACGIDEVRVLLLLGYILIVLSLPCGDDGPERSGQHGNQA